MSEDNSDISSSGSYTNLLKNVPSDHSDLFKDLFPDKMSLSHLIVNSLRNSLIDQIATKENHSKDDLTRIANSVLPYLFSSIFSKSYRDPLIKLTEDVAPVIETSSKPKKTKKRAQRKRRSHKQTYTSHTKITELDMQLAEVVFIERIFELIDYRLYQLFRPDCHDQQNMTGQIALSEESTLSQLERDEEDERLLENIPGKKKLAPTTRRNPNQMSLHDEERRASRMEFFSMMYFHTKAKQSLSEVVMNGGEKIVSQNVPTHHEVRKPKKKEKKRPKKTTPAKQDGFVATKKTAHSPTNSSPLAQMVSKMGVSEDSTDDDIHSESSFTIDTNGDVVLRVERAKRKAQEEKEMHGMTVDELDAALAELEADYEGGTPPEPDQVSIGYVDAFREFPAQEPLTDESREEEEFEEEEEEATEGQEEATEGQEEATEGQEEAEHEAGTPQGQPMVMTLEGGVPFESTVNTLETPRSVHTQQLTEDTPLHQDQTLLPDASETDDNHSASNTEGESAATVDSYSDQLSPTSETSSSEDSSSPILFQQNTSFLTSTDDPITTFLVGGDEWALQYRRRQALRRTIQNSILAHVDEASTQSFKQLLSINRQSFAEIDVKINTLANSLSTGLQPSLSVGQLGKPLPRSHQKAMDAHSPDEEDDEEPGTPHTEFTFSTYRTFPSEMEFDGMSTIAPSMFSLGGITPDMLKKQKTRHVEIRATPEDLAQYVPEEEIERHNPSYFNYMHTQPYTPQEHSRPRVHFAPGINSPPSKVSDGRVPPPLNRRKTFAMGRPGVVRQVQRYFAGDQSPSEQISFTTPHPNSAEHSEQSSPQRNSAENSPKTQKYHGYLNPTPPSKRKNLSRGRSATVSLPRGREEVVYPASSIMNVIGLLPITPGSVPHPHDYAWPHELSLSPQSIHTASPQSVPSSGGPSPKLPKYTSSPRRQLRYHASQYDSKPKSPSRHTRNLSMQTSHKEIGMKARKSLTIRTRPLESQNLDYLSQSGPIQQEHIDAAEKRRRPHRKTGQTPNQPDTSETVQHLSEASSQKSESPQTDSKVRSLSHTNTPTQIHLQSKHVSPGPAVNTNSFWSLDSTDSTKMGQSQTEPVVANLLAEHSQSPSPSLSHDQMDKTSPSANQDKDAGDNADPFASQKQSIESIPIHSKAEQDEYWRQMIEEGEISAVTSCDEEDLFDGMVLPEPKQTSQTTLESPFDPFGDSSSCGALPSANSTPLHNNKSQSTESFERSPLGMTSTESLRAQHYSEEYLEKTEPIRIQHRHAATPDDRKRRERTFPLSDLEFNSIRDDRRGSNSPVVPSQRLSRRSQRTDRDATHYPPHPTQSWIDQTTGIAYTLSASEKHLVPYARTYYAQLDSERSSPLPSEYTPNLPQSFDAHPFQSNFQFLPLPAPAQISFVPQQDTLPDYPKEPQISFRGLKYLETDSLEIPTEGLDSSYEQTHHLTHLSQTFVLSPSSHSYGQTDPESHEKENSVVAGETEDGRRGWAESSMSDNDPNSDVPHRPSIPHQIIIPSASFGSASSASSDTNDQRVQYHFFSPPIKSNSDITTESTSLPHTTQNLAPES